MDFEPCFKVHNLVSVYPKGMKLGQMTNINVIFHVVVSVYRLVTIWNSPQFPAEFRNGLLRSICQIFWFEWWRCLRNSFPRKRANKPGCGIVSGEIYVMISLVTCLRSSAWETDVSGSCRGLSRETRRLREIQETRTEGLLKDLPERNCYQDTVHCTSRHVFEIESSPDPLLSFQYFAISYRAVPSLYWPKRPRAMQEIKQIYKGRTCMNVTIYYTLLWNIDFHKKYTFYIPIKIGKTPSTYRVLSFCWVTISG